MALNILQKVNFRGLWGSNFKRNVALSPVYNKDSKDDAKKKLDDLLQSIIKDDSLGKDTKMASSASNVMPKKKPKKETPKDLAQKIVESAETVSKTLPGKPEETEAQLLHKLLYKDSVLTENLLKAASGKEVLKDLLSKMPIERPKQKVPSRKVKDVEYSRAERVKDVLGRREYIPKQYSFVSPEKVELFGEKPLGIFSPELKKSEDVKMETWDAMRKRDLKLLTTHPPTNIYEQMIIWTERGILWKFPIDNEYGLEEEKNTSFTEHVFLEDQIEDWCPDQGPIRHFMELVCVGMSRNHWLSAKEKKDHLLWYKDFFTSKKELIKELGAGEIKVTSQIE